ncbi:MAG: hypothetical protein IPI68_09780 [Chitinophagaceae bacterium]|nr:hypothetical protein [Chitinophagaceae bacterium]
MASSNFIWNKASIIMIGKRWILVVLVLGTLLPATAQKIVYSEPGKDDTRRLVFEIAGKVGGNFLIYKNNRNKSWITVLDNDMKQISNVEQDYIPDNDRMINVDFFPYPDFCYMIYQYQKKNIVYCMASKIDGNGNKMGGVIELDTTQLGFAANNKIYTVLTSEDKSRIGIFKINSKNKNLFLMTSFLLNEKLALQKKSRISIQMEERNDYLGDFQLDNEGNLVFCKFFRNTNDNINRALLIIKQAQDDTLMMRELNIEKTWLDEIHIKVDNYNKRYLLTSFFLNERRGDMEGFYFYVWDKIKGIPIIENTHVFSEELRREAKGDASLKMAFNDNFIRNIIARKDGGFIISSESYYTTSRFNNWNRWDYLYGSPYASSFNNSNYYSPYYNNFWWTTRSNNNQSVRYHADNITVFSYNSSGQLEWSNVMGKSQYDDESDDLLSYQLMNTGGSIHFLFNQQERRNNLLNDYTISPDGQMIRNPTLKNLDKGYEFMPKYGKQISARQMIIPCAYRNYICFAKVDYN